MCTGSGRKGLPLALQAFSLRVSKKGGEYEEWEKERREGRMPTEPEEEEEEEERRRLLRFKRFVTVWIFLPPSFSTDLKVQKCRKLPLFRTFVVPATQKGKQQCSIFPFCQHNCHKFGEIVLFLGRPSDRPILSAVRFLLLPPQSPQPKYQRGREERTMTCQKNSEETLKKGEKRREVLCHTSRCIIQNIFRQSVSCQTYFIGQFGGCGNIYENYIKLAKRHSALISFFPFPSSACLVSLLSI